MKVNYNNQQTFIFSTFDLVVYIYDLFDESNRIVTNLALLI